MGLGQSRTDWEHLAASDPLWAILSTPEKRFGRWDVEEFFATGVAEVTQLMADADTWNLPEGRTVALDFGCGVGRVTRALAARFERSVGVDVSMRMIATAERLNDGVEGLGFIHNDKPDLEIFEDRSFDLVFSKLVLQHIPSIPTIEGYIVELVRVLKAGGLLVFQLPNDIPLRNRLQARPRTYRVLQSVGVPSRFLSERLRLHPIRMMSIPVPRVHQLLADAGAEVLTTTFSTYGAISSATYWARVARTP